MHPLLIPTSHAEVDIIARNLSEAGSFGQASAGQLYAKIMFGSVLSLTVTESLNGLTIEDSKVIVEQPLLIERVIKRSPGYEVKVITATEQVCELNLFRDGKICGQVILKGEEVKPPVDKMGLYYLTLVKGARLYYTGLFGHKFFIRAELTAITTPATSVKEKVDAIRQQAGGDLSPAGLPVMPTLNYNKRELAENAKALLDWQNKIDTLSTDNPGDWDEHGLALKHLTFLPPAEVKGLWKKYKLAAERLGVGYDSESLKFYLIEWASPEPVQE